MFIMLDIFYLEICSPDTIIIVVMNRLHQKCGPIIDIYPWLIYFVFVTIELKEQEMLDIAERKG